MRWPWRSNQPRPCTGLGIELHQGNAYAVLRQGDGVTQLACGSQGRGLAELESWLQQQQLQGCRVSIGLDNLDYHLHLVEAPDVAADELNDALSFRLPDLIGESTEDKVIQAFHLPQDAYRGRLNMAFAAVIAKDVIADIVAWCRTQQLHLDEISIPELTLLRPLADIEPETSVALLRLDADSGSINIYQNGSLYFTRAIGLGYQAVFAQLHNAAAGSLNTEPGMDSPNQSPIDLQPQPELDSPSSALADLALELRRSLDYFESQLGMGSVGQIWCLPPDHNPDSDSEQEAAKLDALLLELEAQVNTPVRSLSLQSLYNRIDGQPLLTASFCAAIGTSLSYQLRPAS